MKICRDCLGKQLLAGDFLMSGGAGNKTAEYGLILWKVVLIPGDDKVKLLRLDVHYGSAGPTVSSRTHTSSSPNKFVKVQLSFLQEALFDKAVQQPNLLSAEEKEVIASSIHGVNRSWL